MVTLRVYDSKVEVADRYCLYVPTPRNKVKEWGNMGIYLPFNFNIDNKTIIRFAWGECVNGVASMNLGRKMKIDTLPKFVREWIKKNETLYNRALKEDTLDAWNDWNCCF